MPVYDSLSAGINAATAAAERGIKAAMPRILDKMGKRLVVLVRENYRDKSEGGRGADGKPWKRLDPKTLEAKARKKPSVRRLVAQRRALAVQIRATKGKGSPAKLRALRAKRREIEQRIKAAITKVPIGFESGEQFKSASAEVKQDETVIEFHTPYSGFFDAVRPLIPEPFPKSWEGELEAILQPEIETVLEKAFA